VTKELRRRRERAPTRKSKRPTGAANEHQVKQRAHILEHAARLFAESGYSVTTMDVLSEVTEMNKASLYYYFGSKRDILFEIAKRGITDGLQRSLPATRMRSMRDGVVHLIEAGMQNLFTHQNESLIFQQESPYYEQILSDAQYRELIDLQRRYMKVVYQVLQQGIDSGEFRDSNVNLTGKLLVSWINSCVRYLGSATPEELTAIMIGLLLPGLAAGNATPGAAPAALPGSGS
jgi:AcrR family transcriptional regulator